MVSVQPCGRLGNFLFQASACIAYSLKHNMDYCIPNHNNNYFRYFKDLKVGNSPVKSILYREPSHSYSTIPYHANITLHGYYQTHLYFEGFEKQIFDLLGFKYEMKKEVVAIHNRLGDYKRYADIHYNLSDDYIRDAIDFFYSEGYNKFLVFSDGMEETKQRINSEIYPDCNFEYSENNNEFQDMELMSHCEHQVISASTFSLWSYHLNQNPDKICVAPKTWFLGQNKILETKDLYPVGAIKL